MNLRYTRLTACSFLGSAIFLGACSDKDHNGADIQNAASSDTSIAEDENKQWERSEAAELAKSVGWAERSGTILTLHPRSGKQIKLISKNTCSDWNDCLIYVYRGFLADKQFFLVDAHFYEGGGTLLISSKNGKQYDVEGDPHVSPNGKYVVSAVDGELEPPHPGVYLWEIKRGSLIQQLNFSPIDYQLFRFVRWVSSEKVEMIKTTWAKDACENSPVEIPVALVNRSGKWKLEETIDRKKIICPANK